MTRLVILMVALVCSAAATLSGTFGLALERPKAAPEEMLSRLAAAACDSDRPLAGAGKMLGLVLERDASETIRPGLVRQRVVFSSPDERFESELFLGDGRLLRLRVIQQEATVAPSAWRPRRLLLAGPRCEVLAARVLHYVGRGDSQAVRIDVTDAGFSQVLSSLVLDAPMPAGGAQTPNDSVTVALIDSGVNYELESVGGRLARGDDGGPLGYDFWALDERPFDAISVRGGFWVRRHGTQVAGLLLAEAPGARLAPYRYPAPAMERMGELVERVAAAGIRVAALSYNSSDPNEWRAYEAAARRHPEVLFVVAAGDQNRDLTGFPHYPASLRLPNQLAVTSAEADGSKAASANFGLAAVDLAVAAQGRLSTDFDGQPALVSGSVYAAARVAALAACLLAGHPNAAASSLKAKILALARPWPDATLPYTRHGLLLEPTYARRGACLPSAAPPALEAARRWRVPERENRAGPARAASFELGLTAVVLKGNGWSRARVQGALAEADQLLRQCGVRLGAIDMRLAAVEARFQYLREDVSSELLSRMDIPRPALIFHRDSRQSERFDAVTYGLSNTTARPMLRDTIWLSETLPHEGIAVAHELVHLLADSGEHSELPSNLMRSESDPANTVLTARQCATVLARGQERGLLTVLGPGR